MGRASIGGLIVGGVVAASSACASFALIDEGPPPRKVDAGDGVVPARAIGDVAGGRTAFDAGVPDTSRPPPSVPAAAPYFTYTRADRVYRVEARVGALLEDVSAALDRLAPGTLDRWLVPSSNGEHLALSTDRAPCGVGAECLVVTPRDLSRLEAVLPGGEPVNVAGTPAVSDDGALVVYAAEGGPHVVDLWVTRKRDGVWTPAEVLTASSRAAYNNMPALTFDGARVLFDCGAEAYPEAGGTDSCEVRLDGTGFRVFLTPAAIADNRDDFTQFPHDSLDGVLFQAAGPLDGESPETIWLLPPLGAAPVPIARTLANAVSPCALRDGRFGALWLGRPDAVESKHELVLLSRTGSIEGVLTPDVDVMDIGIGCGG